MLSFQVIDFFILLSYFVLLIRLAQPVFHFKKLDKVSQFLTAYAL